MTRRVIRLLDQAPLLDIGSHGRAMSSGRRFTPARVAQIVRTVRRTTEVMVKVTGGAKSSRSALAHLDYISRKGELTIETDMGHRLTRAEHRTFLNTWHLELTAGQYRRTAPGRPPARRVKLTHNIVLSMPHPTPPDRVLAAARSFARTNFPLHRYAMVMHTDQKHPHVHLVVKAENELSKRLRIDKAMLQAWREHFAQLMRDQEIAANATRRFLRGQTKRKNADKLLRAQRRGRSRVMLERVKSVIVDLYDGKDMTDPARAKLVQTRKTLVEQWITAADILDKQGETTLAREVRRFAKHLPQVLTDRERLAVDYVLHHQRTKSEEVTRLIQRQRQRHEFTR